jgi:hypothetical protein
MCPLWAVALYIQVKINALYINEKNEADWIGLKQMFDPNIFVLIASNKIDRQMKVHTTYSYKPSCFNKKLWHLVVDILWV